MPVFMSANRRKRKNWAKRKQSSSDGRIEVLRWGAFAFAAVIVLRLFLLMVVDHGFYQALAAGQHEIYEELFPERGTIYVQDLKDESITELATNQQLAFVYAEPRHVDDADDTAEALGEILKYDEEQIEALEERLDQPEDPYEPVDRELSEQTLEKILARDLEGIYYFRETHRLYPEVSLGGHLVGFMGSDEEGNLSGRYGLEGYFEELLAGEEGYIRSERDVAGRLIAVAERAFEPAVDGADLVLTIDRTIQFEVCRLLDETIAKHQASGGSVVIVEPNTGKVLAMCGAPDYDPNVYNEVESIDVFNNPAIFLAYEPGSIFKPLTMAAAIDAGAVEASTVFEDTGSVMVDDWPKPIGNAEGKIYGEVTMTQVLEDSINTGMIFSMREMGQDVFTEYVKQFGFGKLTGIELETEAAGTISSLDIGPEIYAATATFGQGITTTPLQIAISYAALANGGVLLKPTIVEEILYPDGSVATQGRQEVRRVIQESTSRTIGAMLVSVIEHGHGKRAGVEGYYIAGKTGTAQVARTDGIGYEEDATIGSFAGFGPVEDPKFAMVVRIDRPQGVQWAESTAAPLFGEIAEFLLQYLEIPPTRSMED
jgi:cell division protein FtsI/penicillin-binding protein 2